MYLKNYQRLNMNEEKLIEVLTPNCDEYCIACYCKPSHPILIGDVLDQMMSTDTAPQTDGELVELWRACGFTKSLQSILADETKEGAFKAITSRGEKIEMPLLSNNAVRLIDFLHSIFITE